MIVIVSPHLDDAVLSCGEAMQGAKARILTVFAGIPTGDLPLTHFDANSGFTGAEQAVRARRTEDKRAGWVLGASTEHLAFFDRQYGVTHDVGEVVAMMRERLAAIAPTVLYAPLGLLHPDHELVARVARGVARSLELPLVVYEELPGRVLARHVDVAPAFAQLEDEGWTVDPYNSPTIRTPASVALKAAAVGCYASQAWALDEHSVLVPERFWRLSR